MVRDGKNSKGQAARQPNSYQWRYVGSNEAPQSLDRLREILLASLGVETDSTQFFEPDYTHSLHSPFLLQGVEDAVERIVAAIDQNERIAIYGDYDIDGITATALLMDAFTQAGANVRPYIPDRFEEGYGINAMALRKLKDDGVDLVVTVDCGITSAQEVAEAAEYGLDIIVTDHHTVPSEIPRAAVACINPRLQGDSYPYKDLAGVSVAFKLACALLAQFPDKVKPGREKWLLDLVALGTVCDVVPLVGENRALVQFGLKVLAKTPRLGLRALAEVSGVELGKIQASDLGFRFGPRLNAAGRLEHAAKALELVMTKDQVRAKQLAEELNSLNRERQEETARVQEEAMVQARQYEEDAILVLSDTGWSHGIVGLVASRVSEAIHKPTIILQNLGEQTKGSARSIGAFNIIKAVTSCADLLERYGGHAFAAGMTLKTKNVDKFRKQINTYARNHTEDLTGQKELLLICPLPQALITRDIFDVLDGFEPYGNANVQPVFSAELRVNKVRPVGVDQKHLQLGFDAQVGSFSGISFGASSRWPWLEAGMTVRAAFRASRNVWQGVESLQLEVVDIRTA